MIDNLENLREKIMQRTITNFLTLCFVLGLSGCAAYRTSSNVDSSASGHSGARNIEIFESGTEPQKKYKVSQRIEVSVKKLTLFHSDPTREQANTELRSRAGALGCDAVVGVQYQTGVGLTTWGYIDAQGGCAKFD